MEPSHFKAENKFQSQTWSPDHFLAGQKTAVTTYNAHVKVNVEGGNR